MNVCCATEINLIEIRFYKSRGIDYRNFANFFLSFLYKIENATTLEGELGRTNDSKFVPSQEEREQSEEIGLTKIYAGSNGRTRHPRGKWIRYAACFIFRGWISRSPFSRWLFLKNLQNNVAAIDVPPLFR